MKQLYGNEKKSFFFNVTFEHFKFMIVPLSFEGMVALKLIKRVGSKVVPEEFAAECSVVVPMGCQVTPLIPESL